MNKKLLTISLILLVVGLGLFLSGCTKQPTPISNNNVSNNNQPAVVFNNVVDANNQFALDLYSEYKSKEGNIFFSPYSISSALAMVHEGAKGKTADEMQAVLYLPNDSEKIHSDFVSINNELNKADKKYNLSVANALWAQKDYPFLTEYLITVEKYYGGKATNLDFRTNTEKSRVTINNWVQNKTNDKIKDIIPKGSLTPDTRLVITNAIYFKANWSNQFDAENTVNGQFRLTSGATKEVEMMHQTNYFNYGETGNLQILEMNYLGDDISMLIILPKEDNLSALENTFSRKNLNDWKSSMKSEKVEVSLPKFKIETKYLMADDLKSMGMPTAFKYPDADFTGISPATAESPNGELYIGEVIHQTFIELAEYGTEAAAATIVSMRAGASPVEEQPKIFKADHPFIFIIQQKDTGNILFMGRVTDPTQQ